MKKNLRTVLLKVQNVDVPICKVTDVEDDLHAFYEKLDCDMIELPMRKIGNNRYLVMCDEEALLKADPIVSAMDEDFNAMLFGNLMFFNDDGEGGLLGLSDDDIENITSHIYDINDYKLLICSY